ncbi:uncharacterized protein K452DRAFT_3403 [Aplosporella prunicola CBS 121167]|uniref:Transcription factor domain-containing protein n=1 Tax=Aplosporella prunicola CBS 121167 TaxID=1176127 RepID=A0A6A6BSW5_9PEZI|nr:uncharacterized protein K452DRAFT_3403 [Aplosporella prunicola CBS 121167]KAF2147209.1 hypothetical protein K452DRAFT_3403 [Aplosporella prunicola CBS 121167]
MLVDQFSPIPSRLDRIERQLRGQQSGDGTLQTPSDQFPAPTPVVAEEAEGSVYDPVRENTSSEPPPHTAARTLAGPKFSAPPPNATSPESSKQSQVPDIFEGEITLPADHTTSAHQLLSEWESMEPFFRDVCPTGANYAREEEENRGLLRLYGRGEGEDMYDGGHGGSPAADTTEDDTTPAPSPRDSNGWGFGFTPTAGVEVHRSSPQDWGGLNPDGTLKLDLRTIRRLHQSYLQHIHPLQPFLDKGRLSVMVENFIARYSPDPPAPGNVGPRSPFAVPGDQYGDRYGSVPLKRKRSNNGLVPGQDGGTPPRRMQVERSIGNAIVLLVFALGRICEHKTHLSGPIGGPTTAIGSGLQPSVDSPPTAIKPSPASSHSTLASIPSPGFDGPTRFTSRRSSAEHLPSFEKRDFTARNIDVTPGLAYYAYAVEILGAVHGGNDLSHGQAGVLAALYMGQLARVMESWGWICYACRVCGVLIDKDKDALRPDAPDEPSSSMDLRKVMPGVTTDRRKRNLMKFLFWTCLQLESDILAEMSHLRPSGISKDEERIGLPSQIYPDMPLDPPEEMNWLYYSAQIQLRKILNRTHLALYSKQARKKSFWASLKDDQLEEQLQGWRDTLPQWLQWDDADDPALDINTARMRAKYYGAKYIITRPVLHWAVQQKDPPRWMVKMYVPSSDSSSSPDEPPRFPMDTNAEARWHKVISTSKRCVDAAIQSTLAFDGVESPSQRLIVTNIYGTAHAQFGNMLVLAAVRRSWLRDLIPLARLNELMERTIKFLRRLIPISPTMRVDVAILENTQKCVNGEKSDSASVEASFGA